MFDVDDSEEMSEDELTEDDDIDDAAMEDIDDIGAVLDNLADVHRQGVIEQDICYMTNFAPNMLRRLSEELT
nr:hypothetical protein [Tanacetum cinerariifolium]